MSHYETALNHLDAQTASRDALAEVYKSRDPNRVDVARLHDNERLALKLADIHATLALVDEVHSVVGLLRQLHDISARPQVVVGR